MVPKITHFVINLWINLYLKGLKVSSLQVFHFNVVVQVVLLPSTRLDVLTAYSLSGVADPGIWDNPDPV